MPSERYVTVRGKRFHYIWLRDHCVCPECRAPSSFQRLFDLREHVRHPEPLSVEERDEELRITWKEDPPHYSTYPISWLLSHTYDPQPQLHYTPEPILWNKAWLDANPPQRHDVHSCPQSVWMEELFRLGFTILENMAVEELEPFLSSIGPILPTEFGTIDDIKTIPNTENIKDLSDTSISLAPHTDNAHRITQNVVVFFYCVAHDAKGGESILVDSFDVAKDFRQNHPDYFDILTKTPVPFCFFFRHDQYYFINTSPVLEVDLEGRVSRVCLSIKNCHRDLPFAQTESFYEAYLAFRDYLEDPAYQYSFRLKPGECLLLQNFRLLHGRAAFEGLRHLRTGLIEWDYFVARHNFHQLQHLFLGESQLSRL